MRRFFGQMVELFTMPGWHWPQAHQARFEFKQVGDVTTAKLKE